MRLPRWNYFENKSYRIDLLGFKQGPGPPIININ